MAGGFRAASARVARAAESLTGCPRASVGLGQASKLASNSVEALD